MLILFWGDWNVWLVERRALQWFGHVTRMVEDCKPKQVLKARPEGKRRRG